MGPVPVESVLESRFCQKCQEIVSEGPDTKELLERRTHYADSERFLQAVQQGCYICSWTWRDYRWTKSHGRGVPRPVHHTMYEWSDSRLLQPDHNSLELVILVFDKAGTRQARRACFWFLDSALEDRFPRTIRGKLNVSMRSEETFFLIRQWIQECHGKHPECQLSTNQRKLPTRLVKVEATTKSSKISAKICHSEGLPKATPYLTLSHCWGSTKFLTTTRANLSSFETALPASSLSRTFQDALFATVNLGFQYIWIDSLCIVQDDPKDWEKEALLMHDVYRNSSCNISASGFSNGAEGFILDERRINPAPMAVSFHRRPSRLKSSARQNATKKAYQMIYGYPWQELHRGVIFRRAWTLQEQFLANNTVHFEDHQVYWECKRTIASEAWPCGWQDTSLGQVFRKHFQSSFQLNLKSDSSDNTSLYNIWYDIIADYSSRHITFATDRIPALAGISAAFAETLKDKCVYGLWCNNLHQGILFHQYRISYTRVTSRIMPTWKDSPSWSWVASDTPIFWDGAVRELNADHMCDIGLFHCPGTSKLRLHGTLLPCPTNYRNLKMVGDEESLQCCLEGSEEEDGFQFWFEPDQWFEKTFEEDRVDTTPLVPPGTHATAKDKQVKALLKSILFMPVLYYTRPLGEIEGVDDRDTQRIKIKCLLLHTPEEGERGVYRRAGVVGVVRNVSRGVDADMVKAQLKAYRKPLETQLFQEEDAHGNYTITVV